MYTSMPRAELVGTARFVDHKNHLCCEVVFGKVEDQPEAPLLQRSDAFSATLFQFSGPSDAQNGSAHTVTPHAHSHSDCTWMPAHSDRTW